MVHQSAQKSGINLDSFLVVPIAFRFLEKALKAPVLFWYTPLNDSFIVTVCSKHDVNFMDLLHSLPGYIEYGQDYLKPNARFFLYWDGENLIRIHGLIGLDSSTDCLVADFGNMSGLHVASSDPETYQDIFESPMDYFEYLAVPEESAFVYLQNNKTVTVNHALLLMG